MKKTSPCMMLSVALAFTSLTANAGELVDPPVFTSNPVKQELDLLMVAKPASVAAIPGVTGWAYEICERKYSIGNSCQPGMSNPNPYGGARLQVNPGDTLNIHFVNQLPKIIDSSHSEVSRGGVFGAKSNQYSYAWHAGIA